MCAMSARVKQKGQSTLRREKKIITEIVARLRSCFVHFRMRTCLNARACCVEWICLQFEWKGKTRKELTSRYRRPVCVIKVSLSESVSRLNKVFRWTEFRVTLEENDMRASRSGAESRLHSLRAILDIESHKWAISHSGESEDFLLKKNGIWKI